MSKKKQSGKNKVKPIKDEHVDNTRWEVGADGDGKRFDLGENGRVVPM